MASTKINHLYLFNRMLLTLNNVIKAELKFFCKFIILNLKKNLFYKTDVMILKNWGKNSFSNVILKIKKGLLLILRLNNI